MSSAVTTLLFTDIEGSTLLWEQEGDRMSVALAAHDRLSRSAVEAHRGVIVKMTGDGMYAAFGDPLDAVNAALMLEHSLAAPDATNGIEFRMRYGLHSGMVERRDDDLFGSPVNRAARIMKAAHGGQILLSHSVVEGVRDRLPEPASVRDLGAVRLRDLATPEEVYQLLHPQLRQEFPPLRSLAATPNNLPQQTTSFIGRERELADGKKLLESTRLVTLLGMGGLGKTRLSLQIAADVLEKFPDGVWFVDLAPIKDSSLVVNEAAQALAVHEEPGKPLLQTLCAHLKDHKLLFVLDNCEHLIGACASFADSLLRSTSGVRILATSREALHIRGEQTYPVLPLAVPGPHAGVEALLRSDAVQLFVERARLQKPEFTLTERDAPAVAELCARLDGIPLALELAAARMRSLSIVDINSRLNDRFKLLTVGSRVALERQQTLRALVSWSYDLLQETEQTLLDRLSVFSGGFELAAAEAVCGSEPITSEDVIDLLTSLVDKSLVMVDQGDGSSRYGLLETIREFAREHLTRRYDLQKTIREVTQQHLADRDDVAATAARHCDYYLAMAKTARAKLEGREQAEWMRRVEADLGNMRAAIALALAGGVDPVLAVKFEVALMRFRILRGYSTDARENIRTALTRPGVTEPNVARAHALYVGGVLATSQGDHAEATKLLAESLAIRRSLGDRREIAATLSTMSTLHLQQHQFAQARDCEHEALELFRQLGDRIGEGIGLLNLGEIAVQLDEDESAKPFFEQALSLARSINYQELEGECERYLGELVFGTGDISGAQARFVRSLKVCRDAEDKRNEAIALWWLGKIDAARGEYDAAFRQLADALRAFKAFGMNAAALDCLEDYAALLVDTGRAEDAVRLQSAVASIRDDLALPRSPRAQAKHRRTIAGARDALGAGAFDATWAEAGSWTLVAAIDHTAGAARATVAA